MVPFAGWEMPVLYSSIIEEHLAVRESAGLFDVSHMGEVRLRGPDASELAQLLFTNDVRNLAEGAVRYGLLCLETGGVVDDVTLYRRGPEELLFCVNASNVPGDVAWMRKVRERSGLDCELSDESDATGLVALQGPAAAAIVEALLSPATPCPRRWRFSETELAGTTVWLSRTGYTGEDGFEIYAPADRIGAVWDTLIREGGEAVTLAGLGARDTLRTEMAYPLYGHELDRETDPITASLERFVAFGAGFVGEEALARLRERGPARRRVGLVLDGRQVPREGCAIWADEPVGRVTSGTYGPSVERSIAIGYVPAEYAAIGTPLAIEVRGRRLPARVAKTPFFDRKG
jgi:aminomethyltransferase